MSATPEGPALKLHSLKPLRHYSFNVHRQIGVVHNFLSFFWFLRIFPQPFAELLVHIAYSEAFLARVSQTVVFFQPCAMFHTHTAQLV
jgi:hypothetical protein